MVTTKQAITREVAREVFKWFLKYRKDITSRSLRPILLKHLTPETGIEEMTDYLESEGGRRVWHKAMRDELKAQGGLP